MSGRARGFGARGRAKGTTAEKGDSPGSDASEGSNGEEGAPLRGRGGFFPQAPLRTIPAAVTRTSGEGGKLVPVMTNYFPLVTPKDTVVYQYHIDFNPEIESPGMRKAMLLNNKERFGNAYLFDGHSNLKTAEKLDEDEIQLIETRRTDNEPIQITIKFTGEVGWGHHEMLRLFNTQMRRNLSHLKFLLLGRYFFNPNQKLKIPEHKMEVWQGLLTAINQHDGGTLMVCDTLFKVVRTDTVYDMLKEVYRRDSSMFQNNARKELTGAIVMTSYNNRTYKIDDLVFDKNPQHVFERRHGCISIVDYYKMQYNITIKDENQPLIKCLTSQRQIRGGTTDSILLVPELCVMTGLTESLKNNFDVKKQMTSMTRADANRRMQNLIQFMNVLRSNEKVREEMQNWGLSFGNNVVELTARELPGEKILMHGDPDNGGASFQQQSGDFGKEIRGKKMRTPANFSEWAVIVSPKDQNIVDEFTNTINRVCTPMGIQMNRPVRQVLSDDRTSTFVEMCKRVPAQYKMVVVIVPNNNKDRYDAIKKIFCCERPVASQVVVSRTLSKKQMLMSVCTKIGIQMAVKLGAEAWILNIPPKGIMVIGFDTYHDSTRKGQSVGGFVCSLNATLTKWYSRTAFHSKNDEMSNNFAMNFAHGLKRFYEVNGKIPEKVIVYRDGVSEGQIRHVFDTEVKAIKGAIEKTAPNAKILLAFVIVTKRVNARFFKKVAERNVTNPIPGTIIDTVVTRRDRYDFYLVSQSVRQGTVSPTMYNIIEDETNWKPNHHQMLAYKLCHLYYNWMGTISVPAPCQYAHKLAYLTGTSLHREPSGEKHAPEKPTKLDPKSKSHQKASKWNT